MINILFFAHLKETLDSTGTSLDAQGIETVADIRNRLSATSEAWAKVLGDDSTLAAVNQAMAANDTPIKDGDEVAFFPPVTGG